MKSRRWAREPTCSAWASGSESHGSFRRAGSCEFCRRGEENLCHKFQATGRDVHGGYAELIAVPEIFADAIPGSFSDAEAAPLLCAGAIGYRSLSLTGLEDGQSLGLTGFGASGHLVLKLVQNQFPNTRIYVFARSQAEQAFALELGASWAGDTAEPAPKGCTPSSTRPRRGLRSSRRSRTSSAAGDW